MKGITTPISTSDIEKLSIGDPLSISGYILTGRDAALPKLAALFHQKKLSALGIDLEGSVIFHTAVSVAGVGPTSSNKLEIESSIPDLSNAGVRIHLGKGAISHDTVIALSKFRSIFAIVPPVTALLQNSIIEKKVFLFPELGIEAIHLLKVEHFPAIVASANGRSIYEV